MSDDRIRQERDLYLGLLGLTNRDDPGHFLEEALGLIVHVLGADRGYLEVFDPYGHEGPTWSRAAGYSDDDVEVVRGIVSRGIIAEALAVGGAVFCPSALLDPRFKDRPSVQASKIEAVLCVPIVQRTPMGVLYVQSVRPGGNFSDVEVERARTFARHLAPLVEGLFLRLRRGRPDHVAPFRKKLRLDEFAGVSAALGAVLREVELVAPLDVTVLLTGEMGTGKSQLARVIHDNGPRRAKPFMEVNCGGIPETLIENELFGSVQGAHSTAHRRTDGVIAEAEGGTLFLDEIGELPMAAQASLLQFLNTKQYKRLGAPQLVTADVRIIAATNVDLDEAVREKRFRHDLFFRLNVLPIRMPGLAERRDDIEPLARCLCERAQRANRLARLELSPGALLAIETVEWTGNVRQLANVIERAVIYAAADGSRTVEGSHVHRGLDPSESRRTPLTFQEETRRFQAALMKRVLDSVDWHVAEAAPILDLTRAHVYNLIRTFGLTRKGGG